MKTKILVITIFIAIVLFYPSCSQKIENSIKEGKYLGQTPPGNIPELFAPDIISSGFHDMDITFSPELDEIFITRSSPYDWYASLIHFKKSDNVWSSPELAAFITSTKYRYSYPFISPDGKKLYFNSNEPIPGLEEQFASNIWVSNRNENNNWDKPNPLLGVNTSGVERFPSVASNGNIYFYSRYNNSIGGADIYCCKFNNGSYDKAENVGTGINSENSEFHPYIAPDESYLIFDRQQADGNQDLFISYKQEDGSWTHAINLGETINDKEEVDIRPYVSPDGKYLFFTSTRSNRTLLQDGFNYSEFAKMLNSPENYSQDIYWVDAKIIDDLNPENIK